MDSSRRAVEAYWRSQMIDGATTEDCKITAVYKLEEICELLKSSNASTVKQISEFILKRLDHRNPIVKQKALRLIKYAVVKSGMEFRREMQRNSSIVRQLFHYKGHADLLRGDCLNKAVRDTAHEAISAIFCEESKVTPSESIAKRIQGFGNKATMELQLDDKKSFISEVVGFGSASIKQGLTNIVQAHLMLKNDGGRYKGPTLRRSLTVDSNNMDGYEVVEHTTEDFGGFEISNNSSDGDLGGDFSIPKETTDARSSTEAEYAKTREDKLVATVVASGGVRLQPTRDALQVFLAEAAKLDASPLCNALELKLRSNSWQVRLKAVCVLESILRKKDEPFLSVASYFRTNRDPLLKCSESPQSSLIEKANKVLGLLEGEKEGWSKDEISDLIETAESGLDRDPPVLRPAATSSIIDLFGDIQEKTHPDDPFSDVSFHQHEKNANFENTSPELTDALRISTPPSTRKSVFADIFGTDDELIGAPSTVTGHVPSLDGPFSKFNISTDSGTLKAGCCSALPDIFQPGSRNLGPFTTSVVHGSKKQESGRAFDFISDHVAAARDGKKTVGSMFI